MQKNETVPGKNKIFSLTITALMTAVICVLAPLSIPIGPVPISLTNLVIYVSLYLLGWKRAAMSCLIYILIGLAGLPVFSGFTGGPGKLLGPTGGYIIGFIPMAVLSGLILSRTRNRLLQFLAMVSGTAVCYITGTAWFCVSMNSTAAAALAACVWPFIPGDLIKMLIVLRLCPIIRKRLPSL